MEQAKEEYGYIPYKIFKKLETNEDSDEFFKHSRHIFVLTQTGKPIFSRYGDEVMLSTFMANISAILQKMAIFYSMERIESNVKVIQNSDDSIVVLEMKNQLMFVCVSTVENDSIYLIRNMLQFLNLQIISTITDQINKKLEQRPNYDGRSLLQGTTNQLITCIKNSTNSPNDFLKSFMSLPLQIDIRQQINQIIKQNINPDILYSILLTPINIISFYKSKDIDGDPIDILLILNLIQTSPSLRQSENWIPICLPSVSPDGFLYGYINFIAQNIGMVIISADQSTEMFQQFSQFTKQISAQLTKNHLLNEIALSFYQLPYPIEAPGISFLKHFIIKKVSSSSYTMPKYNNYGKVNKEFKRLMIDYANLYQDYLKATEIQKKDFLKSIKNTNENVCIISSQEYVILFTTVGFLEHHETNNIISLLQRWIKSEENYYLI